MPFGESDANAIVFAQNGIFVRIHTQGGGFGRTADSGKPVVNTADVVTSNAKVFGYWSLRGHCETDFGHPLESAGVLGSLGPTRVNPIVSRVGHVGPITTKHRKYCNVNASTRPVRVESGSPHGSVALLGTIVMGNIAEHR